MQGLLPARGGRWPRTALGSELSPLEVAHVALVACVAVLLQLAIGLAVLVLQ